jgi:hypothetical protein
MKLPEVSFSLKPRPGNAAALLDSGLKHAGMTIKELCR